MRQPPGPRQRRRTTRGVEELPRQQRLQAISVEAARVAGGLDAALLGSFVTDLLQAIEQQRPVPSTAVTGYRSCGERAAEAGVAMRAMISAYLSASSQLWAQLPQLLPGPPEAAGIAAAGEVVLASSNAVVAAMVEGYQLARRGLVQAQTSQRREFIDDLLTGTGSISDLTVRASGFGLDLAGPHAVAVVQLQDGVAEGSPLIAAAEQAILGSKADADALVDRKAEQLVAVFAAPDRPAVLEVCAGLQRILESDAPGWRLALGRGGPGPRGVRASYDQARQAFLTADRLGLPGAVIDAADLQVFDVLLADRRALLELVTQTLSPLLSLRAGAAGALQTLRCYFDQQGNVTATARALGVSVRTVTYRMDRISEALAVELDDPAQRFSLQTAVVGAQLLGWPEG